MYLIALDTKTGEVALAKRHAARQWSYEEVRSWLSEHFSGAIVFSPLESLPLRVLQAENYRLFSVYLSRSKSGEGRLIAPFQTWAIAYINAESEPSVAALFGKLGGEARARSMTADERSAAAARAARAKAEKMTPEERREAMRRAALARWRKRSE